jgi:hypothetical protein
MGSHTVPEERHKDEHKQVSAKGELSRVVKAAVDELSRIEGDLRPEHRVGEIRVKLLFH